MSDVGTGASESLQAPPREAPAVVVVQLHADGSHAARRIGRDPETIRRGIRSGKLRSEKVGTQHLIDERELTALVADESETLALPDDWKRTRSGRPQPDWVRLVRQSRERR